MEDDFQERVEDAIKSADEQLAKMDLKLSYLNGRYEGLKQAEEIIFEQTIRVN